LLATPSTERRRGAGGLRPWNLRVPHRPPIGDAANAPDQEMVQFTQGIYEARELAVSRMQAEAVEEQASGIVGVDVAVRTTFGGSTPPSSWRRARRSVGSPRSTSCPTPLRSRHSCSASTAERRAIDQVAEVQVRPAPPARARHAPLLRPSGRRRGTRCPRKCHRSGARR
jgi:hypothetical protein